MTSYLFDNYSRLEVSFSSGEGSYLFDDQQRPYLDFATGIAVSALGHQHPFMLKALSDQAHQVWHTSNLYQVPMQEALAKALCASSFAEKVLFCNSGLEANEAALKLVRKYFDHIGEPQKHRFLVIEGAFHGRSLSQIGSSPTGKMVDGFGPLPDWFDIAGKGDESYGDLGAVAAKITDETAAIVLEPLQGDGGGIYLFSKEFMQGVRSLCDEHGLLLVLDEIQCGNGRTGKMWCHQHSGIVPDIMTTAKGLGGGFPIGAVLTRADIAVALKSGTHGSTYGGNPLACAVGLAVVDTINSAGFLGEVTSQGEYLGHLIASIVADYPFLLCESLGLGLMRGVRCVDHLANTDLVKSALDAGLLLVPAGRNVVRLLPALTVNQSELDKANVLLRQALDNLSSQK